MQGTAKSSIMVPYVIIGVRHVNQMLLIERDPFVRTDMMQALQAGFPNYDISGHATFGEADHNVIPQLLLVDLKPAELSEKLALRGWRERQIACILTGSAESEMGDRFDYLPRPFSDDMLISAVRHALKRIIVDC